MVHGADPAPFPVRLAATTCGGIGVPRPAHPYYDRFGKDRGRIDRLELPPCLQGRHELAMPLGLVAPHAIARRADGRHSESGRVEDADQRAAGRSRRHGR